MQPKSITSTSKCSCVSILTRPGGRVQLPRRVMYDSLPHVSILTRPGGRVQRAWIMCCIGAGGFQSSPVPEDGCNGIIESCRDLFIVSILTRPGGRVQPVRKSTPANSGWFQSSPVPEDGCNASSTASAYGKS